MKTININELQSKISQVIKAVEKGDDFEIIRYSKPVAVVLSSKKFEKMLEELVELKGSCRKCVDELRKNIKFPISNVKSMSNFKSQK